MGRRGAERTGLTQSHALTPVKHVSSPQRKRTHQMATRSTQCPVAFSLHTALSLATRRWSALPARPAMAASLSFSLTPTHLSFSHVEATQLLRRSSQPADALFSSPSISFLSVRCRFSKTLRCLCVFFYLARLRTSDPRSLSLAPPPPHHHTNTQHDQKRGYGQRQ